MITFRRLCSARARAVLFDFYLGFAVNPLLTFFAKTGHSGEIRFDWPDERRTKFVIKLPTEPPHKTDDVALTTAIDPVSATG